MTIAIAAQQTETDCGGWLIYIPSDRLTDTYTHTHTHKHTHTQRERQRKRGSVRERKGTKETHLCQSLGAIRIILFTSFKQHFAPAGVIQVKTNIYEIST